MFTDPPRPDRPAVRVPAVRAARAGISSVCLGIGRGALDDLAAIAGGKVPAGGRRTLAERATVQAEFARAEAALAGRARCSTRRSARRGSAPSPRRRRRGGRAGLRLAATHAAAAGLQATEIAYRLGGGSAIYDSSPLQRRLRDVNAAVQHMLVAPATWELTGRQLLGLPTDTTQL